MKNIRIFIKKFSYFGGKIFSIFEQACICNGCQILQGSNLQSPDHQFDRHQPDLPRPAYEEIRNV